MKKCYLFALLLFFCISNGYGQRSLNKLKGDYVRFSGLINSNFDSHDYSLEYFYETRTRDIVYKYTTPNSGTFEINETDSIRVRSLLNLTVPASQLSFGASVQIIKQNGVYHEFSLLNISKSTFERSHDIEFDYQEPETVKVKIGGYNVSNFNIGYRYEGGVYLRSMNKARFNIGMGAGIEQNFLYTNFIPLSGNSDGFPFKFRILSTELDLIPSIYFSITDKIFLEMKPMLRIPIYTFEYIRYENPLLTPRQVRESLVREESNFRGSFTFKIGYQISKPERNRRKRG